MALQMVTPLIRTVNIQTASGENENNLIGGTTGLQEVRIACLKLENSKMMAIVFCSV